MATTVYEREICVADGKQSLPFRTTDFCRFHERDKVLIAEIQLILTLTLTKLTLNEEN